MAEDQFAEQIIPGTFIRVQAEALISAGGISSGNIGIVGTAAVALVEPGRDPNELGRTYSLSDYDQALNIFQPYDAFSAATTTGWRRWPSAATAAASSPPRTTVPRAYGRPTARASPFSSRVTRAG